MGSFTFSQNTLFSFLPFLKKYITSGSVLHVSIPQSSPGRYAAFFPIYLSAERSTMILRITVRRSLGPTCIKPETKKKVFLIFFFCRPLFFFCLFLLLFPLFHFFGALCPLAQTASAAYGALSSAPHLLAPQASHSIFGTCSCPLIKWHHSQAIHWYELYPRMRAHTTKSHLSHFRHLCGRRSG